MLDSNTEKIILIVDIEVHPETKWCFTNSSGVYSFNYHTESRGAPEWDGGGGLFG